MEVDQSRSLDTSAHRKVKILSDKEAQGKNTLVCSSSIGNSHVTCCTLLQLLPSPETGGLSPFNIRIDAPFDSKNDLPMYDAIASRINGILMQVSLIDREKLSVNPKTLALVLHFDLMVISKDALLFDAVFDAVIHSITNSNIPDITMEEKIDGICVLKHPRFVPLFRIPHSIQSSTLAIPKNEHQPEGRKTHFVSTGNAGNLKVVLTEKERSVTLTHFETSCAMTGESVLQCLSTLIRATH